MNVNAYGFELVPIGFKDGDGGDAIELFVSQYDCQFTPGLVAQDAISHASPFPPDQTWPIQIIIYDRAGTELARRHVYMDLVPTFSILPLPVVTAEG